MSVRAIFFDIDGTLVDSNEQHVDAWEVAFREAGHPQDRHAIRGQIGKGGDLLIPALLPGVDDALRKRLTERHGAIFKEQSLDGVRPFPGAVDLLHRVHAQGLKLVLASSAKKEELDHYVELLGVRDLLDAATSSDEVDTSKPAPDIFSAAVDKIGLPTADILVVGDTPYDIEAADKAGIAGIGLTSGPFSQAQLEEAGAIAVYADVAALLAGFDTSPIVE